MNEILRQILDYFENDSGVTYEPDQIKAAEARWEKLSVESRNFLFARSPKDLENICIGEVRSGDNGSDLWLWGGSWMPLPQEVHSFLNALFEEI